MGIPVKVDIILGSARMRVSSVMKLQAGSVIALDRKLDEPVDIVVNGRLIARGQIIVMDGDSQKLAVSVTEIVPGDAIADG